jgi:hypothetical protein
MLGPELLPSENALVQVVGPNRFMNLLNQQWRQFTSCPDYICKGVYRNKPCKAPLKLLGTYTHAVKYALDRHIPLNIVCARCGTNNFYDLDSIKIPKILRSKAKQVKTKEAPQTPTVGNILGTWQVVTNDGTANFVFQTHPGIRV